jgi:hypothetical protein
MKLGKKWIVLLVFFPMTLPATELLDARHTELWLGFSLLDFDYEEFHDDGSTANREEGLIPGITAGVSVTQGRWFASTGISVWSGDVDYHGPVETKTSEEIIDWNVLAGREIYRKGRGDLGLFAGFGYRNWERDIQSTSAATGLFETYNWWYGMLGVRGEYHFNPSTQLSADVYLTRTVNPEIEVEFEANYDDVKLALGEETGSRVRLTLDHRLGDTMRVWISPWYEFWELGRSSTRNLTSNGMVTGTVFEPRSETENFGVNIGVTWLLGFR